MFHDDEVPLRSAKNIARQLRDAKGRHSRNQFLSSLPPDVSNDVPMIEEYTDETRYTYNEQDDLMVVDQNDEQLESNSIVVSQIVDDVSFDTNSYLGNSEDDNSQDIQSNLLTQDIPPSSPDTREISTALALFRHRHRLSKSCINNLCDLLRSFGVANVPSDFRSIEKILIKNQENTLQGRKYIICSKCGNKGTSLSKCVDIKCERHSGFVSTPTTLCTFKLLPQVTSILDRHNIMPEPDITNTNISDIQDGYVRRNIIFRERMIDSKKNIVTMLLNSDGIVLKKFSRSIWFTCMVINELPRAIRFNIGNVIICSISMGGNKPKKNQFQSFIKDWVLELQQLELGFHISPPNLHGHFIKVHAYLIAAALDKPAQALLMNLNDPTGYYSCVRCTIQGKSVPTKHGSTRVFIRKNNDGIQDRSNQLYDQHIIQLLKRKSKNKPKDIDPACGQQGHCLLRNLSYFNIGPSFTSDSLHNLYSGTFKRLLEIWFKSRGNSYSIHKQLNLIEAKLDSIKYPTTTYHLPSQLRFYQTYKGNEYRLTLLFGYQ
ncbi:unnamed protein product [Rotaria socialis]|nr:unnamed protein product [Rotaria socialis]